MCRISVLKVLILIFSTQLSYGGASFDCEQDGLNESERRVCSLSDLSNIDGLLSALYSDAINVEGLSEKRNQRYWLKKRNECKSNSWCIRQLYMSRISYLATKLDLNSPDRVKDPQLFTTLDWVSDSPYDKPPVCESFEDVNLDGKKEKVCWPYCGGPACGWYFFVSTKNEYKYLPEIQQGSYDRLSILDIGSVPDYLLTKYKNMDGNIINGWYVLVSNYSYQGSRSQTYYCNVYGRYQKC